MNVLSGWCTLDFIYGALLFFSTDLITMLQRWGSGLERSPHKGKVGCSNPSHDKPKSKNQVVTAPLPNARR